MKFSKQMLREIIIKAKLSIDVEQEYTDSDFIGHKYIVKEKKILDILRWDSYNSIVFYDFDTDKYWKFHYSEGLTEYQMYEPFEYDDDYIECTEVEPLVVMKTVWSPVETSNYVVQS